MKIKKLMKILYMGLLHFFFDLESRGGGMSLRSAGYDVDLFLCSLGITGSTWKQIAAGDLPPLSTTCHSAAIKSMEISTSHFTQNTL